MCQITPRSVRRHPSPFVISFVTMSTFFPEKFLSKLSCVPVLKSSTCDTDLSLWSVEWELANFLLLSLELYNRRTLLWYGGVVRELDNSDYRRSQKVEGLENCSTGTGSEKPSIPTIGSSLSSDFEALKSHYGLVLNALLDTLGWEQLVLFTDHNTGKFSVLVGKGSNRDCLQWKVPKTWHRCGKDRIMFVRDYHKIHVRSHCVKYDRYLQSRAAEFHNTVQLTKRHSSP